MLLPSTLALCKAELAVSGAVPAAALQSCILSAAEEAPLRQWGKGVGFFFFFSNIKKDWVQVTCSFKWLLKLPISFHSCVEAIIFS